LRFASDKPIPPSTPPAPEGGILKWLKDNLFSGVLSTFLTVLSVALIAWLVLLIIDWAAMKAVLSARSFEECREIIVANHGQGARGACWAVLRANADRLLFGAYPPELYWRPILALALLPVALAPVLSGRLPRRLLWFSLIYPVAAYCLIWGIAGQTNEDLVKALAAGAGFDTSTEAGMKAAWARFSSTSYTHLGAVGTRMIGGILLTLIIAVMATALAVPIGVLLELGRRSSLIALKLLCTAFIEFARGIPLIVLLFIFLVLLKYVLPPEAKFDLFLRLALILALPSAVLISEAIRAGFPAIPRGQYEAAAALGLTYRATMRSVILPQVLKLSRPEVVIASAEIFKDTSLLSLIGVLDPLRMISSIRADEAWHGVVLELFVAVALFYWVSCFAITRCARYMRQV